MVKSVEIPTCLTPPVAKLRRDAEGRGAEAPGRARQPSFGTAVGGAFHRKIIGKTWENHGKIMGFSETEYENHGI